MGLNMGSLCDRPRATQRAQGEVATTCSLLVILVFLFLKATVPDDTGGNRLGPCAVA